SMAVNRDVLTQSWSQRRDAMPGGAEERPDSHRFTLRQIFPCNQAQPFDDAARPDPDQPLLSGFDLSHSLHSRSQLWARFLEAGLDAECIASVFLRGHWRDLGQAELQWIARHPFKRHHAALFDRKITNVPLADANDHTIGIQRRKLEESFAFFHRR